MIADCRSLGPALLDWLEHQVVLKSYHPLEPKKNKEILWTEGWRALADQLVVWALLEPNEEKEVEVKRSKIR